MIIENTVNGGNMGLDDEGAQEKSYKIDEVLAQFGSLGKFQLILILETTMLNCIAAWRILFDIFTKKGVEWSCTAEGDANNCSYEEGKMPCDIEANVDLNSSYWVFNEDEAGYSIKSTFKLACSQEWKYTATSSIYFVGAFFGVWIFGRVSDLIGRRKTLMISLAMCVVQGWIIPFSPNIDLYLACRFFDGAAFGGFFLIAFVLEIEYSPPKYRNYLSTAFHIVTSIGMSTVSVWGYAFKDWRWFAGALAVPPTVMLIICFFLIPESPRWELSKGNEKEALVLLEKVAEANNVSMPDKCQLYEDVDVQAGFSVIIKNPLLVRCGLINMFGWFMTSLVYYVLTFSASSLAGDIYVNAAILGAAEIPGRIAAFLVMMFLGRKTAFIAALGFASVCTFVSIWDNDDSRKVMYCFGKALSAALWAVIYLYSSEMYPTKIRNLGSGLGSAWARVAALIAPFVGEWLKKDQVTPYILVGVSAIVSCATFFFVPETTGKDLPQTIAEFEKLFQDPAKVDQAKVDKQDTAI